MLDPAIVAACALLLGQRTSVHGAFLALATAVALALVWRRTSPVTRVVAIVAFVVAAARAHGALVAADATREAARDALGPPSRCAARGVIATSPVLHAGAVRATVVLSRVACGERDVAPLRARLYGISGDAARGDAIDVVTQLAPAQLFFDPDLADPRPAAARSGVTASGGVVDVETVTRGRSLGALVDRARAAVRARIAASYGEATAPLARALVLGEEDLAEDDSDAFRKSGLAHLLAVSGTHLVLVVLGAVAAFRALLARTPLAARIDVGRVAAGAGVVLAFVYADFAGGSGSALRAAWMLAALLGARALGRRGSAPRALGLSALAMGVLDPLAAFDVSFVLSLAATAGLLAMGRAIDGWLRARLPGPLGRLSSPVAASLAASVACAPILAAIAPTLPLAGIAANVVAVPLGEAAALPLCLLHALTAVAPAVERGSALAASGALLGVRTVARIASSAAWGAVPVPPPTALQATVIVVAIAALAGARSAQARVARGIVAAAALLVAEVAAARAGAPRGELRVTFLDVGQGDAALVDFPDGRAMLVDGGGLVGSPVDVGRAVLAPTLRARRRRGVDVAVLSHPHPDHFGGLATLLPTIDVGELWDTGQGEAEGAGPVYAAMLASLRGRGVAIRSPRELCGAPRSFGGASVEILAPCPEVDPLAGPNDNSIVLRLALGRRAALLVGDTERAAEARLLATPERLRADVLKLGHHGSRTSTSPPFLAAVAPTIGVVSVGVRNRFGHPHPSTLATLAAAGVPLLRTDRGGAVVWATDGETARVLR